ncbi:hypothetical protein PVNG_02199 [Plasmodium vivax North Korean]|uniref:Uncharacterized protein n=1 Tax=Plasmodium vivax North Korean TaxID=1035514 RepID=A0A0J9TVE3_PLAVI|nr:hypothetical protein PVNG_02199 [Plasmodium vivax North Korean]
MKIFVTIFLYILIIKMLSFEYEVSKEYKNLDKSVQNDAYKSIYDNVCYKIIADLGGDIGKHKTNCMKLIRNLGHYYVNENYFNPTFDRCNIIYNWLYHLPESEKIPDNIIKMCFEDYTYINSRMKGTYSCSYDSYKNTYLDPMKMNILNIFDNNIQTILQILIGPDNSNKTKSRKFLCECVRLYKEIEQEHCTEVSGKKYKHEKTCEQLSSFKKSYMQYIYNTLPKKDHVPSLEKVEEEYKHKCQENQHISTLTETEEENSDTSQRFGAINFENQGNPMSRTVSTALGTVAGTSSLLALLYKVTQNFI